MAKLTHQQILRITLAVVLVGAGIAGFATVATLNRPSADTYVPTKTVTVAITTVTIAPGDPVTIAAVNETTSDVTLPSAAPYTITKNGAVVYAPLAAQALTTLIAGQERSWTWNQQDVNGKRVEPGSYTVTIPYIDKSGVQTTTSGIITIQDANAPLGD